MSIKAFMNHHFRHFNARETLAAAKSYEQFVDNGGKMLLAMAGAMSTAEIGLSLGEMIRKEKVHAISCTAANLEEDIFNATAHNDYRLATNYRDLSPAAEMDLRNAGMNRVTDTLHTGDRNPTHRACLHRHLQRKCGVGVTHGFHTKFITKHLKEICCSRISKFRSRIPGFTQLGKRICRFSRRASKIAHSATSSRPESSTAPFPTTKACETGPNRWSQWSIGIWQRMPTVPSVFFQIGGGIAGDFAICSVPLILQDLEKECRYWRYFAQISDSTTSYGSYSGAVPNEKITWHKLDETSETFMINSDASIIAPLIFQYILEE